MNVLAILIFAIALLLIIIIWLLYVMWNESKRLNKKYLDKMDEVTKQYFEYDEKIEVLNFKRINLIKEQSRLSKVIEKLTWFESRAEYRRKRIIKLEKKVAELTWDKKILRGRKLTK